MQQLASLILESIIVPVPSYNKLLMMSFARLGWRARRGARALSYQPETNIPCAARFGVIIALSARRRCGERADGPVFAHARHRDFAVVIIARETFSIVSSTRHLANIARKAERYNSSA